MLAKGAHWLIALAVGYLLGSIPVGFLVVRLSRGLDVRRVGSGRTGGTNVLRAAGWGAAVATGLGDALKGAAAVWLTRALEGPPLLQALAGFAAVVGHNYSVFLGLRGRGRDGDVHRRSHCPLACGGPAGGPRLLAAAFLSRHASVGSITVSRLPAAGVCSGGPSGARSPGPTRPTPC
jgi:hypothetical protein